MAPPADHRAGVLEVLPPACPSITASCTTGGLPSEFSYLNLGTNHNKGFELGIDGAVNQALNVFANYSYQFKPDPDFDISEVNLPPQNRFNAGFNYSQGIYLGNLSVSYVDDAFWQDVLDAALRGTTEASHTGERRLASSRKGQDHHDHQGVNLLNRTSSRTCLATS